MPCTGSAQCGMPANGAKQSDGESPSRVPSHDRCLNDAPAARNHNGPDRTQADFEFCLISTDRGWAVEATAQRLMIESEKARQQGFRYAMHTAAQGCR